jgi:UDP-N-acetylglucosamine acyltransferase
MVGSHVAHDCQISSNVILANNATLAGHVVIDNNAIIGGLSGVHQFVHIGKYAMIGGMSGVESNIIPYGLYLGIRDNLRGLNLIGLKRKNVDVKTISKVKEIFRKIFSESDSLEKNIKNLNQEEKSILEVAEILDFISLNLKRGICRYVND